MNTRDLKASQLTLKPHQPGVTLAVPTIFRRGTRATMRGRRTTPGTAATNFHGRARVKRLRLRKLQRIARQVGRGLRTRRL
jgi:hypothetical protein